MRRGPKGRGIRIRGFLAGTGRGLANPKHSTWTTTCDCTNTSTPETDRDDHMDSHQMHQHRQQRKRPSGEQADHGAADTNKHQPNRCRSHNPTTEIPLAGRPPPHRPGVQGSKRGWRPSGGRHHGAPHPPTTMPTGTTGHRNPTIVPLTNPQRRTEISTWTTSGCASTGCSETDPAANKPTMRRLTQP